MVRRGWLFVGGGDLKRILRRLVWLLDSERFIGFFTFECTVTRVINLLSISGEGRFKMVLFKSKSEIFILISREG